MDLKKLSRVADSVDDEMQLIADMIQETLNENSIQCYEVNVVDDGEYCTFEAICSKNDLEGITTMDKYGKKLRDQLRPLMGGVVLQNIEVIDYNGEEQVKLTFDF